MKDTTLTKLLDLMKAYAERNKYSKPFTRLIIDTDCTGMVEDQLHGIKYFDFDSLPYLIEKLKK